MKFMSKFRPFGVVVLRSRGEKKLCSVAKVFICS